MPNAIVDFLGATNDTLFKSVRTQAVEKYGTLNLTIEQSDESIPYFFEIVNSKGETVRKIAQQEENSYSIPYLLPGNYQIRLVKDLNNNGKWDTGNYLKKIQPEEVIYLPEALNLRANWELNERFSVR